MKLNLMTTVMLFGGVILMYSGIKVYDPRDVIRWGLGGDKPERFDKTPDNKLGDPKDNPDPGQRYPGDLNVPDPSDKDNVPAVYV